MGNQYPANRARAVCMMVSWSGNIFHITGHLLGEWGQSSQRACNAELWWLLLSDWTLSWINDLIAGDLRRPDAHVTLLWWAIQDISLLPNNLEQNDYTQWFDREVIIYTYPKYSIGNIWLSKWSLRHGPRRHVFMYDWFWMICQLIC